MPWRTSTVPPSGSGRSVPRATPPWRLSTTASAPAPRTWSVRAACGATAPTGIDSRSAPARSRRRSTGCPVRSAQILPRPAGSPARTDRRPRAGGAASGAWPRRRPPGAPGTARRRASSWRGPPRRGRGPPPCPRRERAAASADPRAGRGAAPRARPGCRRGHPRQAVSSAGSGSRSQARRTSSVRRRSPAAQTRAHRPARLQVHGERRARAHGHRGGVGLSGLAPLAEPHAGLARRRRGQGDQRAASDRSVDDPSDRQIHHGPFRRQREPHACVEPGRGFDPRRPSPPGSSLRGPPRPARPAPRGRLPGPRPDARGASGRPGAPPPRRPGPASVTRKTPGRSSSTTPAPSGGSKPGTSRSAAPRASSPSPIRGAARSATWRRTGVPWRSSDHRRRR